MFSPIDYTCKNAAKLSVRKFLMTHDDQVKAEVSCLRGVRLVNGRVGSNERTPDGLVQVLLASLLFLFVRFMLQDCGDCGNR